MGWFEKLTFGLGLVGTVLGIISTWTGLLRDKPRLRVYPVWIAQRNVVGQGGFQINIRRKDAIKDFPDGQFGIEVVNHGYVAVRLREVGVCPLRTTLFQKFRQFPEPEGRATIYQDAFGDARLPCELLPGARVLIAANVEAFRDKPERLLAARTVYAMTEAERVFLGRGPVLRELQDERRVGAEAS